MVSLRCRRASCWPLSLVLTLFTPLAVSGFLPVNPGVANPKRRLAPILHVSPSPDAKSTAATTTALPKRVEKTDEEWRSILSPDAYDVLRKDGTEPPNTSQLNFIRKDEQGTFVCAGCGSPLFLPSTKFDSGTGWPSFYAPIDDDAISESVDFKLILPRTECRCAACDGHLGHVFDDGPDPTGLRYCMNGVAMKFKNDGEDPELAAAVADRMLSASSSSSEFKPKLGQVLPGALFNLLLGGLFVNACAARVSSGEPLSPIDALPFLLAIYYGSRAAQSFDRLL